MRTFKYLIVLAFSAAFLPASAQNRETSALSASDIASMTWVEAMQDYRVNFHTVVDKFNAEFDGKPYEKGHGWKQFKRWEYMMEERVGESGVRPNPSVLYQAIQHVFVSFIKVSNDKNYFIFTSEINNSNSQLGFFSGNFVGIGMTMNRIKKL